MSRIRTLAASAAAAVLLSLALASPASAHDELVKSNPAQDERLATAPTEISLDFSAEVMNVGAAVIVMDSQEHDWAAGEPTIDAGHVSVPLKVDMPEAGYEIRWRVVSSDGHPISGVIPFTVGDAKPFERAASASPGATSEASAPEQQRTEETNNALHTALIGASGAAVAVVLFVAIYLIRRRSTSNGNRGNSDSATQTESDNS